MKGNLLWFVGSAVFGAALYGQSLSILPGSADLSGPEARHQFLAEAVAQGRQQDLTRSAKWTSSNPKVATVDAAGLVTPVADGTASITASVNGQSASATVRVKDARAPFTWSFRNDVIPVLTKMGCNQGACHGALAGKNGFKLTLRGYDPEADYLTLTRQSLGRRVSLSDPSESLMLLKPTLAIPHLGGKRFDNKSLEYRVIAEWIAAGAPAPAESDVAVTGLEVYPASAILKPEAEQQLVVRAKYADGRVRDVTRWVKFGSSDEGVALVDDSGRVKMTGHGEAAVTLYYSSKVLYSRLTVPYANTIDPGAFTGFERRNSIDDFILAKFKALNIAPSAPCSDSSFIRRAYLDAAGILPTAEEVE
ncbi:MAG: Ig-like domain-containing protein, partial [Bryobacteraceae bacterium]